MTAKDFTWIKTNLKKEKKKENHGIEAKDGTLLITDSQQKSNYHCLSTDWLLISSWNNSVTTCFLDGAIIISLLSFLPFMNVHRNIQLNTN